MSEEEVKDFLREHNIKVSTVVSLFVLLPFFSQCYTFPFPSFDSIECKQVEGHNCPRPVRTFHEAGLDPVIVDRLLILGFVVRLRNIHDQISYGGGGGGGGGVFSS